MSKKLSALPIALALLAFSVPAMANASTGLTQSGFFVKVGTEFKMTSTNMVRTSTLGSLTCATFTVFGTVTKNNPSEGVALIGNGKSTSSGCFLKGTTPITITNITLASLTSSAAESGTAKVALSYEADLPGLTCKVSATAAPATYAVGTGVITFTGAPFTTTPAACGTVKIDGDFALTTAAGAAFTLD